MVSIEKKAWNKECIHMQNRSVQSRWKEKKKRTQFSKIKGFVYFPSHTYTIFTYTVPLKCCVYRYSSQNFFFFCVCFRLYLKRHSLKLWDQRETDTISFLFLFFINLTMSKKNGSLKQHGVKENEREGEGVVKESQNNVTWFGWAIQGFVVAKFHLKDQTVLASPDP